MSEFKGSPSVVTTRFSIPGSSKEKIKDKIHMSQDTEESKLQEFTMKIHEQIAEMFSNPDCKNHIDLKEVKGHGNEFFHALANLVPWAIYKTLTGNDVDTLSFNHIANKLCMQDIEKKGYKKD